MVNGGVADSLDKLFLGELAILEEYINQILFGFGY